MLKKLCKAKEDIKSTTRKERKDTLIGWSDRFVYWERKLPLNMKTSIKELINKIAAEIRNKSV